jgi:hypothetical protein
MKDFRTIKFINLEENVIEIHICKPTIKLTLLKMLELMVLFSRRLQYCFLEKWQTANATKFPHINSRETKLKSRYRNANSSLSEKLLQQN